MLSQLILLTTLLNEVRSSSNYCMLKLGANNATSGQLDCQTTNTTAIPSNVVMLRYFHVRWRDGRYETRISGLSSTRQIEEFANNALLPLVSSDGLLLEYLEMPVLQPHVLAPLKSTLRRLRLRNTQLNALNRKSVSGMVKLELLAIEDNFELSLIEDDAFQDLSALLELRIEQCPALRTLSTGLFNKVRRLRSFTLIDTGIVNFAPKIFCPLIELNMLEWSSRIDKLEVSCDTFSGLVALRSLTVKQRPSTAFQERNVIHENNKQCALCALPQLTRLDGISFSNGISPQSCPKLLPNQSCIIEGEAPTPPTPEASAQTTKQMFSTEMNASNETRGSSNFNVSFMTTTPVLSFNFTNSTDDPQLSSSNSYALKVWLPIGLISIIIIICLTAWCVRKRSVICNACKYCHILTSRRSYSIIFKSKKAPHPTQPEAEEFQTGNGSALYAKEGPASMPRGVDAGTFFLSKNSHLPPLEQDGASCNSYISCPWPVENSELA